jgi:phosphatidylglycerophosphate synthase
MENQTSDRIQASFSSNIEKRVLVWIAARLPRRMTPDHLTAIGFAGAIIAGLGYILTNWHEAFLWLSTFGFIVNWYGDSLDGTLARVRKIQRPKYGFFIDHNVDALTALVITIGAGISPYFSFSAVLLVLIAYLIMCIFTYINTYLRGVLKISYSGLGPTELRLAIIILNTFFYFVHMEQNSIMEVKGIKLRFFDLAAVGVALVLMILYFYYFFKEKSKFEIEDPPKTW